MDITFLLPAIESASALEPIDLKENNNTGVDASFSSQLEMLLETEIESTQPRSFHTEQIDQKEVIEPCVDGQNLPQPSNSLPLLTMAYMHDKQIISDDFLEINEHEDREENRFVISPVMLQEQTAEKNTYQYKKDKNEDQTDIIASAIVHQIQIIENQSVKNELANNNNFQMANAFVESYQMNTQEKEIKLNDKWTNHEQNYSLEKPENNMLELEPVSTADNLFQEKMLQTVSTENTTHASMIEATSQENMILTHASSKEAEAIENKQILAAQNTYETIAPTENALYQKIQVMVNKNENTAKLVLDPPELGNIEIKLSRSDDKMQIAFITSLESTREIIESGIQKLRGEFENSGLTLGDVQVAHQEAKQEQNQNAPSVPSEMIAYAIPIEVEAESENKEAMLQANMSRLLNMYV